MGTPTGPYALTGTGQGFRWRVGDRAVEVQADPLRHDPGRWQLTASAFGSTP